MKTITRAVLATLCAFGLLTQQALAQDNAKPNPVEAFFCNFKDGKTMADLDKVNARFAKWAAKNDPNYSAWVLTPRFANFTEVSQVVWLGSNLTGDAMGTGLDTWIASGSDLQAAYDEILACAAHSVASSVPILTPDGPPTNGVVMFSECSMAEEGNWSKAVAAHGAYANAMRELGAKNSSWLFFPMLGGMRDRGFDYYGVVTFKSWSDYFAAYEIYVNGGGWQKGMEAMQGNASCEMGSATVWDFKLIRQGEGA